MTLRPLVRLALLSGPLLLLGCVHTARLERAGCEVDFHGGRLNGSPVEVVSIEQDGLHFTAEYSQFVYEITPPFQSLQAVIDLSFADPATPLPATPETLQGVLAGFTGTLPKILPGLRCEPAGPDVSFSPVGVEQRCGLAAGGVPYSIRVRAVPAGRGLLLQVASWTTAKGKTWSDAFWSSLRALPSGAPPPGSAPLGPAAEGAGETLATELFGNSSPAPTRG